MIFYLLFYQDATNTHLHMVETYFAQYFHVCSINFSSVKYYCLVIFKNSETISF